MKKAMKQALTILLTLTLLLGAVPILAATVGAMDLRASSVGDTITFGAYPQTRVTSLEGDLLAALDAKSKEWKSYGYYSGTGTLDDGKMTPSDYMKYCDLSYGGNKYRAVTFTKYRPHYTGYTPTDTNSFQDNNKFYINKVYYFKFEPLTWRVLDPANGLVVCTKAIDSQPYQNFAYALGVYVYNIKSCADFASDWESSSIRTWLNQDFYNTAFSSTEKSQIATTHLENKCETNSLFDGVKTDDKIFLLSSRDVLNTSYGFRAQASYGDTARQFEFTDYAKCQGCEVLFTKNTAFWLRTAYDSSYMTRCTDNGYADSSAFVGDTGNGVVPAFRFLSTYSVTYNANGGTNAPAAQDKVEGSSLTLRSTVPTKDGYIFKSWNTKPDGTGTSYNPGGSYTANANATLYAQWTADTIASIKVNTLPTKLNYYVGNDLDTAGLTVTATYKSGKTATVTEGFTCSPTILSKVTNTQTITVSFGDKTTSFTVKVLEVPACVHSVSVNNLALRYLATEKLQTTVNADEGLLYKLNFASSDESIVTVTDDGIVYGKERGTATITCTVTDDYNNVTTKSCTVTVDYAWWQWLIVILLFGWIWY